MVLVTDPFGPDDPAALSSAFSRGLVPYKEHHVIDLDAPLGTSVCLHHRRNARKALSRLTIEQVAEPREYLDVWCGLYTQLIQKHGITGVSRFSRHAFELQLAAPWA